jgi:hypothetical protein
MLHLRRDTLGTRVLRVRLDPRKIPCTGSQAAGAVNTVRTELVAGRTGSMSEAAGHVSEEGDHRVISFTGSATKRKWYSRNRSVSRRFMYAMRSASLFG